MSRALTVGRHAAAALLVALAAGCARPPDEAWLRFLGFRSPGGSSALGVVNAELLNESTDTVDAAFENATLTVGKETGGTGILVERARVEYRFGSASPPSYDYPVTLYLPAPAKAGESASGTLAGLPIVPASLKTWVLQSGVPRHPEVQFTARVTFYALTDDGNRLEVGGSIPVVIANTGGTSDGATVSVVASDPTAAEDPLDEGEFTVSRDGSTSAALAVTYSLAGSTATNGTDFQRLDLSVVIPAGSSSTSVTVTPVADAVAEGSETVKVTLGSSDAYTVGPLESATVTITD